MWETNISPEDILIHSYIFCIAYSWYGSKKVHVINITDFPLFKKDIHDDTEVLKAFSKIAEQADILVGHNIDKFDIKKFNARLVKKKLAPVPRTKTIDTLKLARQYFGFSHNSLDAVSRELGVGGKVSNKKGMWRRCFEGIVKDLLKMARYCKNDIVINKGVLRILIPFMKTPITKEYRCQNPICMSYDIQLRGVSKNKKEQRFVCNICKKWGQAKIRKQDLTFN